MRNYKKDIIVIAVMVIIGFLFMGVVFFTKKEGKTVTVEVAGELVAEFPLSEDRTYVIQGKNGGTNTLVIENGYASIEEASCPDSLCVHMGKIHNSSQSIVCLPNQVVVGIKGKTDADTDVDIIIGR